MSDLDEKNINDFSTFYDFLKDGEVCLYVPKSGMTVNPPDGIINVDDKTGSFIAGDKYYGEYKETCNIYRDMDH